MNSMRAFLAVGALLAIPAAAAAQATVGAQPAASMSEPVQRSFVYLGHDLRVTIAADAAGTIKVVRGEDGRLDLDGRVTGGLASATLAEEARSELTLSSSGASRVDWILAVPRDVRVSLRLPDQPAATLGTLAPSGSWSWGAPRSNGTPLPTR